MLFIGAFALIFYSRGQMGNRKLFVSSLKQKIWGSPLRNLNTSKYR